MDDNPVSCSAVPTAPAEAAGTAAALVSVALSLASSEFILSFNKATSSLSASVSPPSPAKTEAQFINKNKTDITKAKLLEIRIISSLRYVLKKQGAPFLAIMASNGGALTQRALLCTQNLKK
jgi:hypothetical protein